MEGDHCTGITVSLLSLITRSEPTRVGKDLWIIHTEFGESIGSESAVGIVVRQVTTFIAMLTTRPKSLTSDGRWSKVTVPFGVCVTGSESALVRMVVVQTLLLTGR